jgi:phosphoglycerol transferase MdoB-like AlkP superfamily enzyme
MDHSLGAFIADARREAYFDDTIFMLFGDHGRFAGSDRLARAEDAVGLTRVHVPAVILGRRVPGAPREIEAPASEVDVLPTLAALAGVPYVNTTLGRDLLDPRFDATRFAFTIADHLTEPKIGLLTAGGYLKLSVKGGPVSFFDLRSEAPHDIAGENPEKTRALAGLCRGLYEASRWLMYHNAPPPGVE